jgi:hypothetical protein
VVNPVEQITAARRRLKQVAAIRAGLLPVIPALTALIISAMLPRIGAITWGRLGYEIDAARLSDLRLALLIAGIAGLCGCALMAWRAYREADDFIEAAERVDDAVNGHQEIVTLASLADPAAPSTSPAERSPLFPLLWRRAAGYLERFDPARAFAFEVRPPILRSLPIAAAVVVILAATALALVRPPTPEQIQAHRLRAAARELARSPSEGDKLLASKVLAAAAALENPKLPPEQKLQRLADAMSELENRQQRPAPEKSASGSGSGNGKGKGSAKGTGQGQDKGNGQGQAGQGQGASPGQNSNGSNGNQKSNQQIVELRNDLSKAQAQIEAGSGAASNSPKPGGSDKGNALRPGKNPNKKGPSPEPDNLAQGKLPKPNPAAKGQTPSGLARNGKNDKGGHGDTHLGEFPAAENFQRFYKTGEGPGIQIRDARYVVFRLPTEIVAAGGGKLVPDTTRPSASVPYANVPLKNERLDTTPEERQLVPPRYRDLIR